MRRRDAAIAEPAAPPRFVTGSPMRHVVVMAGTGAIEAARRVAASSLAMMVAVLALVGLGTVATLGPTLDVLGATGETRTLAARYLGVTSLSLPLLAVAMCCSALLRSVGDARRWARFPLSPGVAPTARAAC